MLLTISYSESAYPITPVEPLKASLYDYSGISVYFVYFIFICFSQVLLKLFTFLINTADKEIYNIFNSFFIPLIL